MNFPILVEVSVDIITILIFIQICMEEEKIFLKFNTFSPYGHIGPTKGSKPRTQGP